MTDESKYSRHTYSYLALRRAVGCIAMLLPFALMLGEYIIFGGKIIPKSISHYYYLGMGDVFVGALCAIGLFLFFYSGYDKWDDWAGNIAGFFAIGVALFPTGASGQSYVIGKIHDVCAVLLFIMLTVFSLFLFTKKAPEPTRRKLVRNKIYIICGLIMAACIISVALYSNFFSTAYPDSRLVFISETVALIAFGVSWLVKGETLLHDE